MVKSSYMFHHNIRIFCSIIYLFICKYSVSSGSLVHLTACTLCVYLEMPVFPCFSHFFHISSWQRRGEETDCSKGKVWGHIWEVLCPKSVHKHGPNSGPTVTPWKTQCRLRLKLSKASCQIQVWFWLFVAATKRQPDYRANSAC